jgi:glycosyltransferase involved in cell wall biosynthesis
LNKLRRIIVSVTNDLVADNRVHKACNTLTEMGFGVLLTGRCYKNSPEVAPRSYTTRRLRHIFRKGPLFYAEYNLRLFLFLLFSKCDILLSNDLDTLPGNALAAKLKRIPLVYDSHEYFTEVPELIHRPRVRQVWQWLEERLVPGVSAAYTVCQSIAEIYTLKYSIPFRVVRNVPESTSFSGDAPEAIPEDSRSIIIYQGALNLGRGLEQAIRAMEYLPEAVLVLAGSGDKEEELRRLAAGVSPENVRFTGRLPLDKLTQLTRQAALGLSIEEDMGLNYRFALPNKLFDYIQAGIPVVISNLPEMRKIVEKYNIGLVAASHEPQVLADTFREALFNNQLRNSWKAGLRNAASDLTWENEKHIIEEIFSRL